MIRLDGFRDGDPMKHFTLCLIAATLTSVFPLLAQQPQPAAQNPGTPGSSGQIQQRLRPPARIMNFTAEPANLKPGESALLTWATENPNGVTIDQGVGKVTPRGTIKVTPTATTTYTLTINGADGALTRSLTVNVAGTVAVAANTPATTAKKEVPGSTASRISREFTELAEAEALQEAGPVAGGAPAAERLLSLPRRMLQGLFRPPPR